MAAYLQRVCHLLLLLFLITQTHSQTTYFRIWKPVSPLGGPYPDFEVIGNTMVMHLASVRAFSAVNSSFDLLRGVACTESSNSGAGFDCSKAVDGNDASLYHSAWAPTLDLSPFIMFTLATPAKVFSIFPRPDCCWSRSISNVFSVLDASLRLSWGGTIYGTGSAAPFNITLPLYSLRITGVSSVVLNLEEVAAYSVGSVVNRLVGGTCAATSSYTTNSRCEKCTDGSFKSCNQPGACGGTEGCSTAVGDLNPTFVFSVVGTDPVDSILIQPRSTFAARASSLLVELLLAATGTVLWSTITPTPSSYALSSAGTFSSLTASPLLLPVTKATWGPWATLIRVWKPASEGPYWDDGNGNPEILNLLEIRAFTGRGNKNIILNAPCAQSTSAVFGSVSCDKLVDGVLTPLTHSHSSYTPTLDTNALYAFPANSTGTLDGPVRAIEISPRSDGCFGRSRTISVELVNNGIVSWGEVAPGSGTADPFNVSVPAFSVRISSSFVSSNVDMINFMEIQVFSANSTVNRILGGKSCRSSSYWSSSSKCSLCIDGTIGMGNSLSPGCTSFSPGDPDQWMVFSISGEDAVASIIIYPRSTVGDLCSFCPGRSRDLVIQVLRAPTGEVIWSGGTASVWTTAYLLTAPPLVILVNPNAPPPSITTLRIWKPAMEGPYSCSVGNCFILHLTEVVARSTPTGANILLGAPCSESSAANSANTCSATVDGNMGTISHTTYMPTFTAHDLNPSVAYTLKGAPLIRFIEITPRLDCCLERNFPLSVELTIGADRMPSWGEVIFSGTGTFSSAIVPNFTLRVSGVISGRLLNFEEVSVFEFSSSTNLVQRPSATSRCRGSSYWLATTKCSVCSDGSTISTEGCSSNTDTLPYFIFSLASSATNPAIIVLQPRLNAIDRLPLNVTLLNASSGVKLFEGAPAWGLTLSGVMPIVINVSAPPSALYALRLYKNSLEWVYSAGGIDATPFALTLASVRVFANDSSSNEFDVSINAPCTQRSSESATLTSCGNAVDNIDTTFFSSATADTKPELFVYILGANPANRIKITPSASVWGRAANVTFQLMTKNGAVSWGGVFEGSRSSVPFSLYVSAFSIRLTGMQSTFLNLQSVSVYGVQDIGGDRAIGQPCTSSSSWTMNTRCSVCIDGIGTALEGCSTASDSDNWMVFSVANLANEPVARISLLPRAALLSRSANVRVELLIANTGEVVWAGNTPSTVTSTAPIVFIIPTPSARPSMSVSVTTTSSPSTVFTISTSVTASTAPTGTKTISPLSTATASSSISVSFGFSQTAFPSISDVFSSSLISTASVSLSVAATSSTSSSQSFLGSVTAVASSSVTSTATTASVSSSAAASGVATSSQSLSVSATAIATRTIDVSQSVTVSSSAFVSSSSIKSGASSGTQTQCNTATVSPSQSSFLSSSSSALQTGLEQPSPSALSSLMPSTSSSSEASQSSSALSSEISTASIEMSATVYASASTSESATVTASNTPTPTTTQSMGASASVTPSSDPTASVSPSSTLSMPSTVSMSGTSTGSETMTGTPTSSTTPTTTMSLSRSISHSPTASVTIGAGPSLTGSDSGTDSSSSTASESVSGTGSPTGSGTSTSSQTPSSTTSITKSVTRSPTASVTKGAGPSLSGSDSGTDSSTSTASESVSGTRSPTGTGTSTSSQTPSSTTSLSSVISNTPTSSLSIGASASITPSISDSSSATATVSPTNTPSATVTQTASSSGSDTVTSTTSSTASSLPLPSLTASNSPSSSPPLSIGASPSRTSSDTSSPSATSTMTGLSTPTAVETPSRTATSSSTSSPTRTALMTITASPSLSQSSTQTPTATLSRGASASISPSAPVSPSQTESVTMSITSSSSRTPSATTSASGTVTSSSSLTASFSRTPTSSMTVTASPTSSLSKGASPSATSSILPSQSGGSAGGGNTNNTASNITESASPSITSSISVSSTITTVAAAVSPSLFTTTSSTTSPLSTLSPSPSLNSVLISFSELVSAHITQTLSFHLPSNSGSASFITPAIQKEVTDAVLAAITLASGQAPSNITIAPTFSTSSSDGSITISFLIDATLSKIVNTTLFISAGATAIAIKSAAGGLGVQSVAVTLTAAARQAAASVCALVNTTTTTTTISTPTNNLLSRIANAIQINSSSISATGACAAAENVIISDVFGVVTKGDRGDNVSSATNELSLTEILESGGVAGLIAACIAFGIMYLMARRKVTYTKIKSLTSSPLSKQQQQQQQQQQKQKQQRAPPPPNGNPPKHAFTSFQQTLDSSLATIMNPLCYQLPLAKASPSTTTTTTLLPRRRSRGELLN